MANPILVETLRGNWVENIHRGSIAICDATGDLKAAIGDVGHPVFPRSAIKALQALAIFRSGAAQKYDLDDQAIALACASHFGEPGHVEIVARTLAMLGLSDADLECGTHPPTAASARELLRAKKAPPSALHNNCSGKHTGMLATALALGVPTKDYVTRNHPVQKLVRACVEEVIGQSLTEDRCGTDGCSIPTWAAPLDTFAAAFARMATGQRLPADLAAASTRIFDAATANPFLIRGTDSLDTEVMQAFGGRLMLKIGAEGVFCGALRNSGLGFALKIDDGNMVAAECAVANLLLAIAKPDSKERSALDKWTRVTNRNWRKIEVAETRGTKASRPTLS